MQPWKQAVARAFDGAAGYDGAAAIQAVVAEALAVRMAALPLGPGPRVLEIGCGTGFLTAALRRRLPEASLLATDLAPAMLRRCRARMGADLPVLVMDGERPCLKPGFDVIASSLAAQWFEDLPGALARLCALLAPGGHAAVTTLASETFREWHGAHASLGLEAGTPRYPDFSEFARLRVPGCTVTASRKAITETHSDGRAFLSALRAIGAGTPAERTPLSPGALRRVLRRFEAEGARVTYEVVTLLIRRT